MIRRLILLVMNVRGHLLQIMETESEEIIRLSRQSRGVATCTEAWLKALDTRLQLELYSIDPLGNLAYGEPANVRPNQIVSARPDRRTKQFKARKRGKKLCGCGLCASVQDALDEGEAASQLAGMEDNEVEHTMKYAYDETAPAQPME